MRGDAVNLVIAMPCYDTISRETAVSLAMLTLRLGAQPPEGLERVRIEWRSTSNLPESRAVLAHRAIEQHDASHILWIDSDSGFPSDSLHRLLAHDVDIVGATFPRRVAPHWSSASDLDGKPFSPELTGLVEAGVMGFGLLLTRRCVFEGEYEMPLFAHHDANGYCTEDVTFSHKVRARGHRLWCDMDISRQCKHVGSIAYGFEHMEAKP